MAAFTLTQIWFVNVTRCINVNRCHRNYMGHRPKKYLLYGPLRSLGTPWFIVQRKNSFIEYCKLTTIHIMFRRESCAESGRVTTQNSLLNTQDLFCKVRISLIEYRYNLNQNSTEQLWGKLVRVIRIAVRLKWSRTLVSVHKNCLEKMEGPDRMIHYKGW